MSKYEPAKIEPKWQEYWEEHKTFKAEDMVPAKKYYILDMFPYPSGAGLHVGHPEGYTASDIIARYKRMLGMNVLHTIGWDAFGLPAEQYAIKTGTHPRVTTEKNIETFRRQIKALGFSYDWDREINTTDPDYVKWTQWLFLKLYERGLAYVSYAPVNWCPALGTVLANEEVIDGKSEVGGYDVVRKPMRQWMLKITAYAQRLLDDLEELDWPERIKAMQRNWIGRSMGAEVDFEVSGHNAKIRVFTTRPDTLFGSTFMVLSPEHALVEVITTDACRENVDNYKSEAAKKSDLERTDLAKDKTGVFTGAYAINPVNGKEIPIWIADYVLSSYGTGAVMSVPGHDSRDWAFAKKFDLPIVEVLKGGNVEVEAFEGDGVHVNSEFLDGLGLEDGKKKMIDFLEERGIGKASVNFKLRDWLFSRQRYWGEPFPILWDKDGNHHPLPEEQLPLNLPEVDRYEPSGTGESPLANIKEWLEVGEMRRETNTMPQWAGSCWYYLRYIDPHNKVAPWDPEKEKYWMPVDFYIGGAEHAVLHLLYARFWHKVFYDAGLVSTKEPFQKLFNQGMILGYAYKNAEHAYVHVDHVKKEGNAFIDARTGEKLEQLIEKMSKSRGNVVNPDAVIDLYGADSLRLYEMFMGPLDQVKPWDTDGVNGVNRFLAKAWRLITDPAEEERAVISPKIVKDAALDAETEQILHFSVRKIGEDIDNLRFNTAISQLMVLQSALAKLDAIPHKAAETFVLLLSPFAPHLGEELWQILGHDKTLAYEPWPTFDPSKCESDLVTMGVQILGKMRGTIEISKTATQDEAVAKALELGNVAKQIGDKPVRKIIYVPGKILNLIV